MGNHQLHLHSGWTIWPEHKPLQEVELIKATTPESIWFATYQGTPTRPGGSIFRASWWEGQNRYDSADKGLANEVYARYISWDTALKANKRPEDDHDFSAYVVAELWPDYRLGIRYCYQEHLEFPELPKQIAASAGRWNYDDKLRAVLIEDKVAGTSALQTLRATADDWLRELLVPFIPTTDKQTRAGQAAVWAQNGCILLPQVARDLWWVMDFEDQLYEFPRAAHDDLVDAFSQLILYLEHYLEHGFKARMENIE